MTTNPSSSEELSSRAYEALNKYFTENQDEVIEIAILPPAIEAPDGVLMHEGLNLGIPKKTLVSAFLEARRRFFDSLKHIDPLSNVSIHKN